MKWLGYAVLFLAVWYVFRKIDDEVFTAIDRRLYPEKVTA